MSHVSGEQERWMCSPAGLHVNAGELVEGQHMSKCSESDTVFIALPLSHFREMWIEFRLTKGLFPPKSLRYRLRCLAFH